MKYLLDTHILIWWLEGGTRLSANQKAALNTVSPTQPLLVSDISLWEIGTLVELGRIKFSLPLRGSNRKPSEFLTSSNMGLHILKTHLC